MCIRLRPAAGATAVAAALLAAPAAPALAASGPAVVPLVVTARLLAPDPAAPPGADGYLVEVDEVRHGGPPAGVVAVRLEPGDGRGRALAARALAGGEPLELTLVRVAGGEYRAIAVRSAGDGQPPDPLPPPIAVSPPEVEGDADGAPGRRRRTAAATAGAPFEHQVLELVNEERLANGNLPPLKGVGLLDGSAGGHSSRMATGDFFAHCDPDAPPGSNEPHERMLDAGYLWNLGGAVGENIAAGFSTPQGVMAAWMASPGHRANILSSGFRELGVGYSEQAGDAANVRQDLDGDCTPDSFGNGPFVRYWTQNFGRRDSVFPVIVERETFETACAGVDLYTYGTGWAQEMRFSNDGVDWSPWMPFAPDVAWTLAGSAGGTATVFSELRNGGTVRAASDAIGLTADFPATADLDLSAQTVTGTESFTACDTITAGDGFHVAGGGDATFTARRIVLRDGFSVAAGATFRAATR